MISLRPESIRDDKPDTKSQPRTLGKFLHDGAGYLIQTREGNAIDKPRKTKITYGKGFFSLGKLLGSILCVG